MTGSLRSGKMIDMKTWEVQCAQLQRGQTTRANHIGCKAGEDRKKRLYLTRPAGSPGVVLAYCHNCQEHGIERNGVVQYRDYGIDPELVAITKEIEFEQPTGLEVEPDNWPTEAHVWRIDKHLTYVECIRAGIAYDANSHRIYLPQYDQLPDGFAGIGSTLLGYQLRKLTGKGPKYLTAVANGCTNVGTLISGFQVLHKHSNVGYVVEDLASGLALLRGATSSTHGVEIMVNYGTKINPILLARCKDIDHGIVWLDNDSDHVIDQAKQIARVWNMVTGKPTYVTNINEDPKDVGETKMHAIQEEHATWSPLI
jgi:hypothetical protein